MKYRSLVFAAVAAVALSLPSAALAFGAVVLKATTVRTGPGQAFPAIGVLKSGMMIRVKSCDGMWCTFMIQSKTAFIEQKSIRASKKTDEGDSIFDRWGNLLAIDGEHGHKNTAPVGSSGSPTGPG